MSRPPCYANILCRLFRFENVCAPTTRGDGVLLKADDDVSEYDVSALLVAAPLDSTYVESVRKVFPSTHQATVEA